ncbi:MAG: hypothetical protein KDA52_21685, partial [Planctomycetaceae bacterium]|nr:hypothetical protein [Planctomycetaceae bacterium]
GLLLGPNGAFFEKFRNFVIAVRTMEPTGCALSQLSLPDSRRLHRKWPLAIHVSGHFYWGLQKNTHQSFCTEPRELSPILPVLAA